MALKRLIERYGIDPASSGGEITFDDGSQGYMLLNPPSIECGIASQAEDCLVVIYTEPREAEMSIDISTLGKLKMVQLFASATKFKCRINQQSGSRCEVVSIITDGAEVDYTIDLNGKMCANQLRGAYVVGGKEQAKVGVRVNHYYSDSTSNSLIKGVAGGEAYGKFEGMVYVEQDAQRTDARQTSRNILLTPTARIETDPQLEIYADDVKCSHGATVGQMDSEAIYYMRQRGLSEAEARKLQIEGFVGDIAYSAGEMGSDLAEELASKLNNI